MFHELLGFKERDGALLGSSREARASAATAGAKVSLAPHAPYSTSLELFRATNLGARYLRSELARFLDVEDNWASVVAARTEIFTSKPFAPIKAMAST